MDHFSPQPFLTPSRASPSSARIHLARVLRSKRHALLMFYSKSCGLCQAMRPMVNEVAVKEQEWLEVCRICTDDQKDWAPEMQHYGINYVPCFVMLLPGGYAITKSGPPHNKTRVQSSLVVMLDYSRRKRHRQTSASDEVSSQTENEMVE